LTGKNPPVIKPLYLPLKEVEVVVLNHNESTIPDQIDTESE
jgi:hypothetical protein